MNLVSKKIFMLGTGLILSISFSNQNGFIPNGFWKQYQGPGDYETYVRIKTNTGFKCVLDNKSSFRFTLIGDSMTTPMNGMNFILWAPGSGDIIIQGSEKGTVYSERYRFTDSTTYFNKCSAEEAQIPTTTFTHKKSMVVIKASKSSARNILGRKSRKVLHSLPN